MQAVRRTRQSHPEPSGRVHNQRYAEGERRLPERPAVLISTAGVTKLTCGDLERLVESGYLENIAERMEGCAHSHHPCYTATSTTLAYVLTDAGTSLVCSALKQLVQKIASIQRRPHWGIARRELRVDDVLVRRFQRAPTHQELILSEFEAHGWPHHIDDPLPSDPFCDPKQRLHDAIKRLNRGLLLPLVRFSGDGSGTGVRWRFQTVTFQRTASVTS